jgi:hypothetical protein
MGLTTAMLPVKQPNGMGPRHARGPNNLESSGWQRCYVVSLTLLASAALATLVTFGVLNLMLADASLPPMSPPHASLGQQGALPQQQPGGARAAVGATDGGGGGGIAAAAQDTAAAAATHRPEPHAPTRPLPPPRRRAWDHQFEDLRGLYSTPPQDGSERCKQSKICDGDHSCGPDERGCITSATERQDHVRKAIAWAWEGYRCVPLPHPTNEHMPRCIRRCLSSLPPSLPPPPGTAPHCAAHARARGDRRRYAWGHDEVDVLSKSPHAWFNLGLTIVDSLDTLLIAGLLDEYQEARHWVANHLYFHDGASVQFFEVNIRILGGLVSAYYLSDGDELYLHKAEQLADRCVAVACCVWCVAGALVGVGVGGRCMCASVQQGRCGARRAQGSAGCWQELSPDALARAHAAGCWWRSTRRRASL